ncbi:YbaB/EbfC DNA-binding family protein [Streptomyces sp. WMMB 714]|uniref:YbaB/EbfC family nucleoid-associated protein n=1 Tax=Streptomyces sp. WMMB 714 TaxID=1286822 RepID=UPI000698CB67|nr:YbaB/EbfC family nucleoid-associated protein [Streptomyces sp. WMMB 714]SCK25787.1 YbaB/EbfC DNA-binding family protein [Streptomyces sp. WMMB 714]
MADEILAALRNFQQYTAGLQGLLQEVQRGMPPGAEGRDAGGAVTVRLGGDGLPETVTFARDWPRKCEPEALGNAVTEAYGAAMSASMAAMQRAMEGMDLQGRAEELRQEMERGDGAAPRSSTSGRDAGAGPFGGDPGAPGQAPGGDPGAPSWTGGGDPGAPSWTGGGDPGAPGQAPGGDPGAPGWAPGGAGPMGPPVPAGPPSPGAPGGGPGDDPAPVDVPGRDLRFVVPRPIGEVAEEMMNAFDSVSGLNLDSLADAQVEGKDSGHRVTVVLSKGNFNSCRVDASWAQGKSAVALGQAVEAALSDGRAALARLEDSAGKATQDRQLDGLLDEALAILRDPKRFTGGL